VGQHGDEVGARRGAQGRLDLAELDPVRLTKW
jgi:hypothetical protein